MKNKTKNKKYQSRKKVNTKNKSVGYFVAAGSESPEQAFSYFYNFGSLLQTKQDISSDVEDAFTHTKARSVTVYRVEFVPVRVIRSKRE